MLISHELPISLLKEFNNKNDYDFILPRFWDNYPEYRKHYSESVRFKILDNGLFEGDSYSDAELLAFINDVKPDLFIVPDAWNDSTATAVKAKSWIINYKLMMPKKTKLMPVLQGETFFDFKTLLYNLIDLGYEHFAFNHSSEAYQTLFTFSNKLVNGMLGRIYFINELKKDGLLEDKHYIHLLGANLPQEFMYYEGIKINSVDTSNPIITGALGIDYKLGGLLEKPINKLEEFMTKDLSSKIGLISYNINRFREFCK